MNIRLRKLSLVLVAVFVSLRMIGVGAPQVGGEDCIHQLDQQSTVAECLAEVPCGTGVCCTQEQQAMNWNRCTPDGDQRKLTPVKKFFKIRYYGCNEFGVCTYVTVDDSEEFRMDCQTETCEEE